MEYGGLVVQEYEVGMSADVRMVADKLSMIKGKGEG